MIVMKTIEHQGKSICSCAQRQHRIQTVTARSVHLVPYHVVGTQRVIGCHSYPRKPLVL